MLEEYEQWAETNTRSWAWTKKSRVPVLLAYFKSKTLRSITPWLIEKYKVQRRQTVKAATVNRELALLSHLFTKAIEWGRASEHPIKGGRVRRCPGEKQREKILPLDAEQRLLRESSAVLRQAIVLALDTGMRLGEILGLTWDRVNLARGEILVTNTKNSRPRRLPLTKRAEEVLRSISQARGSAAPQGRVLLRPDGRPLRSLREAFLGATKRAGLEGLRFHDLRHTFATRLVTGGVDIVTVQRLLGHQSLAMTQRYAHPTSADIRHAIETLERATRDGHFVDTVDRRRRTGDNVTP